MGPFKGVYHLHWTCLQVELKFFHEREAQAVEFLCFLRQKRARGGQLPEPEMRSEGLSLLEIFYTDIKF